MLPSKTEKEQVTGLMMHYSHKMHFVLLWLSALLLDQFFTRSSSYFL